VKTENEFTMLEKVRKGYTKKGTAGAKAGKCGRG
jgi:hypothetical protein